MAKLGILEMRDRRLEKEVATSDSKSQRDNKSGEWEGCGHTFCKIQPDLFQLRYPCLMAFCRNKDTIVLAHITPSVRPSITTSRLNIKRTISLPPKMLPCIRQFSADIRINNSATPILLEALAGGHHPHYPLGQTKITKRIRGMGWKNYQSFACRKP